MIQEWIIALPIIIASLAAVTALVIGALTPHSERITYWFSLGALALVGMSGAATIPLKGIAFSSMIHGGSFAALFDALFALGGILTIIASRPYIAARNFEHDEYYTLVLYAVSGMMLIVHAQNFLILFIGIEVMSLSFYVLAGYFRQSINSVESALKYFLLGAFATGFLLLGIALVYGATGTIDFTAIGKNIHNSALVFPRLMPLGIALLIVGLGFKIAVFPFHQWVPDVYEGAPTVVTGFMSTAGKAAALSAFIPLVLEIFPGTESSIRTVLAASAAATIIVGNIAAVVQNSLKRMLAYSSVAHAGYMLIGIMAGSPRGLSAVMFYAVAYLFMQFGAFVIISVLEQKINRTVELTDCSGLSKIHPVLAALMALFMFSLVGLPPFAGFFGKYYLFTSAIEVGYTWLAIIGVIGSMISAYYYIGVVVFMYFRDTEATTESIIHGGAERIPLFVSAGFLIALGILPSFLESLLSSFWNLVQ